MTFERILWTAAACIAVFAAAGCGDPGKPKDLAEQDKLVRGRAPTQEELAKAMSRFKAPPAPGASNDGRSGAPPGRQAGINPRRGG